MTLCHLARGRRCFAARAGAQGRAAARGASASSPRSKTSRHSSGTDDGVLEILLEQLTREARVQRVDVMRHAFSVAAGCRRSVERVVRRHGDRHADDEADRADRDGEQRQPRAARRHADRDRARARTAKGHDAQRVARRSRASSPTIEMTTESLRRARQGSWTTSTRRSLVPSVRLRNAWRRADPPRGRARRAVGRRRRDGAAATGSAARAPAPRRASAPARADRGLARVPDHAGEVRDRHLHNQHQEDETPPLARHRRRV